VFRLHQLADEIAFIVSLYSQPWVVYRIVFGITLDVGTRSLPRPYQYNTSAVWSIACSHHAQLLIVHNACCALGALIGLLPLLPSPWSRCHYSLSFVPWTQCPSILSHQGYQLQLIAICGIGLHVIEDDCPYPLRICTRFQR